MNGWAQDWRPESDAPEGWRRVGTDARGRSTWLTDDDELVFVPMQVESCDECHGEAAIEDDHAANEWRTCPDCDGEGYIEGSEEYDFGRPVAKIAALKLERLHASHGDISKWEWWVERVQS
jgi:hypothetical protein